jgi:hypothetical protein
MPESLPDRIPHLCSCLQTEACELCVSLKQGWSTSRWNTAHFLEFANNYTAERGYLAGKLSGMMADMHTGIDCERCRCEDVVVCKAKASVSDRRLLANPLYCAG